MSHEFWIGAFYGWLLTSIAVLGALTYSANRRVQQRMREHPATVCEHPRLRCRWPACTCGVRVPDEAQAFRDWMAQWPEHSERDRLKMFSAFKAGIAAASGVKGTVASRAPDIRGVDEMDVPAGVMAAETQQGGSDGR